MKRLLLICVVLLAACNSGPTPAQTQATIAGAEAATVAAIPTLTPTPISLANINLEPLLVQPGDLPNGMTAGQISDRMWAGSQKAPTPANIVTQDFDSNMGFVTVVLYATDKDLTDAYQVAKVSMGMGYGPNTTEPVSSIGTTAAMTYTQYNDAADLSFLRCRALVYIAMAASSDQVIAYAKRLDKRLSALVCP